MGEKANLSSIVRHKLNRINQDGIVTFLIPLDEIFIDAIDNDEATLESEDGTFKKTIMVAKEGKKEDEEYIRLTFRGIKGGKKYTLTYDTKEDADDMEVAKIVVYSRKITFAQMGKPIRLDKPFEDNEDKQGA